MATVHAPQLFTRPPEEDPAQLDAGIDAMRELGKRLEAAKPDVVIIFGSDHMETFFLQSVPTFSVVAGERANAAFAGKTWAPAIHQRSRKRFWTDWSAAISIWPTRRTPSSAIRSPHRSSGFSEAARSRGAGLHQYLSAAAADRPPLRRAGQSDRRIVVSRPERVALLASGGMYKPAYDFDRWCIHELENGHDDSFLNLSSAQLDEVGNTEMLP
jgi:2,3-dihydroxyphenylpropionate 1,2-dioxygenase